EENGSSSLISGGDHTAEKLDNIHLSHENVTSESSMETMSTSTSPTSSGSPRTGETVSTTTTRLVFFARRAAYSTTCAQMVAMNSFV
ncbi:hypothetical protein NECAME_14674, partial [Necator americanus]